MELVKLSKRLQTVAGMVTKGNIVADIGTDHGYLPIYLVQNNISERVIAMDVNKGPLNKAHNNIMQFRLENRIDTRLSDGLKNLERNEVNTITICGMGGKLIAKILENGRDKITQNNELILSPQSEIQQFREYILLNGYKIVNEEMLIDDGKFYVILKCILSNETKECNTEDNNTAVYNIKDNKTEDYNIVDNKNEDYNTEVYKTNEFKSVKVDTCLKYGKYLLEHKNNILKEYLMKEQNNYLKIRKSLDDCESELVEIRIKEIEYELRCIKEGLSYYEM